VTATAAWSKAFGARYPCTVSKPQGWDWAKASKAALTEHGALEA